MVSAAVPVSLVVGTARAAMLFTTGQAAGAVPASAALLAKGALRKMWFTKLKIAAALLVTVALVGTGLGVFISRAGADGQAEAVANSALPVKDEVPKTPARDAGTRPANTLSVKGLVVQAVDVKRKTITVSSEPITMKFKGELILDGGAKLQIEGLQLDMGYQPPKSEFRVDRKASIQLKGKAAELADLKPGMKVTVELGTGREQALFNDKDRDLERQGFLVKGIQAE